MVITGASQGIGKNLAIEFSRKVTSESTVLLIARSLSNLEDTKKAVLSVNPSLNVKVNLSEFFMPFIFYLFLTLLVLVGTVRGSQ